MNGMKRLFLIAITIAVIVASIYIIIKPSMMSKPPVGEIISIVPPPSATSEPLNPTITVHPRIPPNVVELPKIGNELTIETKYNNKTSVIDPTSDEGRLLLSSAHQVMLGLPFNATFKREVEINALKKNSSYIEIKLKNSHDLTFGRYTAPSVRLVFIMGGIEENVGLVASLPSEEAEFWRCEKAQQDSPQFLRLMAAHVDATTG